MKYNIAAVVSGRKREINFTHSIVMDDALAAINHAVGRSSSVEVSGKVYRVDDVLWINLTYVGMVQFVCDRCLQPFDYSLNGQLKRQLSSRDEFDVEWLLIERNQIDLAAAVADDLMVELPMQLLCSEQCKGLCATCGIDLNRSQCQCKSEAVDPRLASLKNLFN